MEEKKVEISIIPIQLYSLTYQTILLVCIILVSFVTYGKILKFNNGPTVFNSLGLILLIFSIFYIGLRPVNGIFVDMTTYARLFSRYEYDFVNNPRDPIFHYFTLLSSRLLSINIYFLACSALYIVPLYIASKKLFGRYWVYGFLFLIGSLSFWNYGTNGIRNGIASSLFILGISRERFSSKALWIAISVGFHMSMLLPAACLAATYVYKNLKIYIYVWIASIFLSLVTGDFFENLFSGIGFGDERIDYLSNTAETSQFDGAGFRWDFLIYSAIPILAGWYYVIRKKYIEEAYTRIFCTYTLTNSFWILVIQANFSNRFAYLSWFMMGIVISYPLLKKAIIKSQRRAISLLLIIYFGFTYLMSMLA